MAGRTLGWFFRKLRLRARVVDENLALAYPGDAPEIQEKRRQIFNNAYEHLGNLILEILMIFGPMSRYARDLVDVEGLEHWEAARQGGKGVIFLASHVGNWEIMAAAGGLMGIDVMLVSKHFQPEWLHRAIEKGRNKCGVRATYEPRTLRDLLSHLKKNGTVGFVLDQYVGAPIGIRVPVFGKPVGTNSVIATLSKRTGAPVLPVICYRTAWGRQRVEVGPVVPWIHHENSNREIALNTARYAEILEKHILSHPEQWLWIHRRFKGDLSPLREGEWDAGRARRPSTFSV